jgi:hypothetical protein
MRIGCPECREVVTVERFRCAQAPDRVTVECPACGRTFTELSAVDPAVAVAEAERKRLLAIAQAQLLAASTRPRSERDPVRNVVLMAVLLLALVVAAMLLAPALLRYKRAAEGGAAARPPTPSAPRNLGPAPPLGPDAGRRPGSDPR